VKRLASAHVIAIHRPYIAGGYPGKEVAESRSGQHRGGRRRSAHSSTYESEKHFCFWRNKLRHVSVVIRDPRI
jgi:hypothetical protein